VANLESTLEGEQEKNLEGQTAGPALTRPSISVFFPAYNDAGTIPSMVLTALITCRQLTDDYEVIVINDGSKDYTAEVLDELAAIYPNEVRVIHHQKNRGYGGALRSGFAAATKDLVFYTDGDAQYDPHELKLLLETLTPEVDIVNGYKIERNDPFHRIIIGKLYHWTVKFAFRLEVRDTDCDFRLIRRKCFDSIELTSNTGTICLELVKKLQDAGYKFAQVPVHHYHRAYGKSQFFNFPRLWRTGVHLLELWWRLMVRQEHKRYLRERVKAQMLEQTREATLASADSSQD
jgi:glycosyltransferase involved in cell wall biosynthesis